MSKCSTCLYASFYEKPERPEEGFATDVIEVKKNSKWKRFWTGQEETKIYRGGNLHSFYFDQEKFQYDLEMEYHLHKVYCEALPKAKVVNKHTECSYYKEKK